MRRLLRNYSTFLLPLVVSVASHAANQSVPLTIKQDAPTSYTVVKGDTLWDISELYLDSPWLWPRLWQVNPEIDNPHLIYPGDRLNLIWKNGQPVLSVKPMKKLSPKVRLLDKQPVPTLADELVLPYLESDRLLSKEVLENSARVLGSSNGRQYLTHQEHLYISGQQQQPNWGIYRQMATFTRDEHVAVALKRIARAERVEINDAMTSLSVTHQVQEILINDIALPEMEGATDSLSTTFYPAPTAQGAFADVLGTLEGSNYVGENDVVVLNRGQQDDLDQGSMFELYQQGSKVDVGSNKDKALEKVTHDDMQFPDTHVGNLIIIRPYQHFSLALITESKQPIDVETKVVAPKTVVGDDK
ncbi:LysM peptidoglycan-binding domain-containing protein [Vibrio sp. RE86]|uniref:LysM peptidoglycan-binding domain-containing protein n=1 Tax=Vibrio sp. RE86 TaxID=2607605 RepID=UPI0014933F52|nr:LysM peptidoglycan-binding domain-containing protein [Vibrio sp. RE86]NOH81392.1 LysM peptidoglycan-binding domain-containing protein [Vibrio sp. RE86]